jgi:predicted transcriptional regulator
MAKSKKETKKEIIVKVLRENPDGLTIQGVSKKGKMSRITATIYLHELLGEKKVLERKIGAYRMFFLKDKYLEPVSKKEIVDKIKKSL